MTDDARVVFLSSAASRLDVLRSGEIVGSGPGEGRSGVESFADASARVAVAKLEIRGFEIGAVAVNLSFPFFAGRCSVELVAVRQVLV